MIDFAKITIKAGNGGQGAGSFVHVKGKRLGKANGGDGGRGGDVYFETTGDLNTLEPFRFVKFYQSEDGQRGLSRKRKGAEGKDLTIKVPQGTLIKIINHTESPLISYDLINHGQKILVAKGGMHGRGNIHLKDEFGRRPKVGEKGEPGEEVELSLELKLIADVGLIGLPNAGKSTLLAALTSAKPEIADYPFTTLEPNLGVLDSSWFKVHGSLGKTEEKETINRQLLTINKPAKLVLADIPGLIEGASKGRGLGDLFLRHIERTKILVHLVDSSTNSDKWQDYQVIRAELKSYSKELTGKKEIIALNKSDLLSNDQIKSIQNVFKKHRKKTIVISANTRKNLDLLLSEMTKKMVNYSREFGEAEEVASGD